MGQRVDDSVKLSKLLKVFVAAFDNGYIRHNAQSLASGSALNAGKKVHEVSSQMKIWTLLDSAADLIYHGATYYILTWPWYAVIHYYLFAAKNNVATHWKLQVYFVQTRTSDSEYCHSITVHSIRFAEEFCRFYVHTCAVLL